MSEDKKLNENEELKNDIKEAESESLVVPKKKKHPFNSKKFKRGGIAIAITCGFIIAVVILNIVVSVLAEKIPALSFDLTSTQKFELTEESKDFLKTVDKEITITLLSSEKDYMSAGDYYIQVVKLVKQYPNYNKNIKVDFVNLVSDPTYQSKYPNETLYASSIVVSCGDNYKVLDPQKDIFEFTTDQTTYQQTVSGVKVEPSITTAILNVTSDKKTKVSFVKGFGDYNADAFKTLLNNNNYDVNEVSPLTGNIESNTSVLILFGPTVDVDTKSMEKISAFLKNDGNYGKTFLYIPAPQKTETPVLNSFLEEWNIALEDGLLAELSDDHLIKAQTYNLSVVDYADTDFTAGLKNPSNYLLAGNVVPIKILNGDKVKPLLTSSDKGGIYPYDAKKDYDVTKSETAKRNISVISTATGKEKNSYVIVNGSAASFDAMFINDSSINNGAYYINLINKQSGHEDQTIAIDSKGATNTSLGIVASQITLLGAVFMIVIPLGILIAGLVIWLRRRNR